jgi:hypothetical protein
MIQSYVVLISTRTTVLYIRTMVRVEEEDGQDYYCLGAFKEIDNGSC